MAASASVLQAFLALMAGEGLAILEADAAAIETSANTASDAAADKIITNVTNQIKTTGVEGLLTAPLKTAIVAAEPEINTMINDGEDALITTIETALKNAVAKGAAPPTTT